MDPTYLIVNADDYGYFRCVSRGILEAIRAGSVTATGVLANGPHVHDHVDLLSAAEVHIDVGIHLNLTLGSPLTPDMARRLDRWNERFPGKFAFVAALVSGKIYRAPDFFGQ